MNPLQLSEVDINSINNHLATLYGIDTVTGQPIWRIVWSDDQYEKRFGTFDDITPNGIYLRTVTEVRLVPKYKQWIHQRYILERLVQVPEQNSKELGVKISYEPIWTFEDKHGNYLPPKYDACDFLISTIYAAQYGSHMPRYSDPDSDPKQAEENTRKRIDGIVEELFGEQSALGGSTYITGDSIIVPRNFERNS